MEYCHWCRSFIRELIRGYKTIRSRPGLLLILVSVWVTLTVVGIIILMYLANKNIADFKNTVTYTHGQPAANQIKNLLEQSLFGAEALAAHIYATQDCHALGESFPEFAITLMSSYNRIRRLEFDVSDIVGYNMSYVYPHFRPNNLTNGTIDIENTELYNCNLLSVNQTCYPLDRKKELLAIFQKSSFFSGPFEVDEVFGVFALKPIWKPASSFDVDLGCGISPTCWDNGINYCYDNENKVKYFGSSGALVKLDDLRDDKFTAYAALSEFDFRLKIAPDLKFDDYNSDFAGNIIYSNQETELLDPVRIHISILNLRWQLEISPRMGWSPVWYIPAIVAVTAATLLLAFVLLRILILTSRYEDMLLSMLPRKVVNHLQITDALFAENFDFVTVLFADIVDYTVISSGLSPRQVVSLLDDLYTKFDHLAKNHGVYKGKIYATCCSFIYLLKLRPFHI